MLLAGTVLHAGTDAGVSAATSGARAAYENPALTLEQRVEDLLGRMTLEEKVGQMCQYVSPERLREAAKRRPSGPVKDDMTPEVKGTNLDKIDQMVREGRIGSFLTVTTPEEANRLQSLAAESRLRIPLLLGIDAINGNALVAGTTVFPTPINLASTFDPELVERVARATAVEVRAHGSQWTFSPNVDVARDARWGRVGETFGEDPLLVGILGAAMVRGYQGSPALGPTSIMACIKHMIAGSQPINGLNYAAADVSERTMREIFLPPYEACIRAGAATAMAAHNELGGIPCHANQWLIEDVFRREKGFAGFVVSDWTDVERLVSVHHVAVDMEEAVYQAVTAGLDMHMHGPGFFEPLVRLVRAGRIAESRVDESVRRILRAKFALGLFEDHGTRAGQAAEVTFTEAHRQLALEAARKSIVLLKNTGSVLPLGPTSRRILVTGPLADSPSIMGWWAGRQPRQNYITIAQGLKQAAPAGVEVSWFDGGDSVRSMPDAAISGAVRAAQDADVVVAVVGEKTVRYDPDKTSGENVDRSDLELVGRQLELVQALAATGRPVIVVLSNSRPLASPWIFEHVPAVVEAWEPGCMGGQAVAEVLFGTVNPSGRLPISFPRSAGHIQTIYNHKPADGWHTYALEQSAPAFPFGAGLSYTTFTYSNLKVAPIIHPGEPVIVSVDVANTGSRTGDEVVLLYMRDLVSSVTTPVKALKAFRRVTLAPTERRTVAFEVAFDQLALLDRRLRAVVEPGEFSVMVGGLNQTFRVEAVQ